MSLYNIDLPDERPYADALVVKVGFGDEPASNDQIVADVESQLSKLGLTGGPVVLVNGPASLPVAFVLAHHLNHLFGVVGVWDPKLQKYVIAVSHSNDYKVGDLY